MPNLELYSVRDQIVQPQAGLNWGLADAHVNSEDAYIALTTAFFRNDARFFPPHGSIIEVEWDDGEIMTCLLEGTQEIEGMVYPKQLSSYNDKSIIGHYLRQRLGVSATHKITMEDLDAYGRNSISAEHISGNKYFFDFS